MTKTDNNTGDTESNGTEQSGDEQKCVFCDDVILDSPRYQLSVHNHRMYGPDELTYTFCSVSCLQSFDEGRAGTDRSEQGGTDA